VLSISLALGGVLLAAVLVWTGPEPAEPLAPALSAELQRPNEAKTDYKRRLEALAEYKAEVSKLEAAGVPLAAEQEQLLLDRIARCQEAYGRRWAEEIAADFDADRSRERLDDMLRIWRELDADVEAILSPEQREVARFASSACTSYIVDDERLRRMPNIGQGWPETAADRDARVAEHVRQARVIGEAAYVTALEQAELDEDHDLAIRRAVLEVAGRPARAQGPTVDEVVHDPRLLFDARVHDRLRELLGDRKLERLVEELRFYRGFVNDQVFDYAEGRGLLGE
jgi:hypothetical protein